MTATAAFPPIAELVPHGGPMRLLHRVVSHRGATTVCAVDPAGSRLLSGGRDRVPVWVGVEYMAQCIAVHGGLVARERGETPRPGILLGSRRVRFGARHFEAGRELRVTAHLHRGERKLVVFDCEVGDADGGPPLATGRLNVYIVESWQDLTSGGPHEA